MDKDFEHFFQTFQTFMLTKQKMQGVRTSIQVRGDQVCDQRYQRMMNNEEMEIPKDTQNTQRLARSEKNGREGEEEK